MTALVYYNEPNWISIVSILISLSSVCSKLLLLVLQGQSHGWKFPLWIWLCFVSDFLGIFFIVSFAFYTPAIIEYQQYFLTIRSIVCWEFIICIAPFIVGGAMGINIYWIIKKSKNKPWTAVFWIPSYTFLMIIGVCIVSLTMQIFACWWAGLAMAWVTTSNRLPSKEEHEKFYRNLLKWIIHESKEVRNTKNEIILTKRQDKILKICVINKALLHKHTEIDHTEHHFKWKFVHNERAQKYFESEQKTYFQNVTLRKIRDIFYDPDFKVADSITYQDDRPSYFVPAFYFECYGQWYSQYKIDYDKNNSWKNLVALVTTFWLTFITGPFYVISRFLNHLMPIFILFYLYIDGGILLWTEVDGFQVVMWVIYVFMLCVWWLLLILVLREDYYTWHILPSSRLLRAGDGCDMVYKSIKDNYFEMTVYPMIQKIINDIYGDDIGFVIMEYYNCIEVEVDIDEEASLAATVSDVHASTNTI